MSGVVVGILALVVVGSSLGGAAYAADPAPAPTASQSGSVSVTIPGTGSSTPPASGGSGTGGTSSGSKTSGGKTSGGPGGGSTAQPAGETPETAETNPDGSPIVPDEPSEDADDLELDHEMISVGEWMIATGTGYTPGEKVQVVLYSDPILVGSFVADAAGRFTARFKIPKELRLGDHVVEATGWASHRVTNQEFTLVSPVGAGGGGIDQLWWLVIIGAILLLAVIIIVVIFRKSFSRLGPITAGAQGTTA